MVNWFINKSEEIKNESVIDLLQDFIFSIIFLIEITVFALRIPLVAINNVDVFIQTFFLSVAGFFVIAYCLDIYCILSNRLDCDDTHFKELRRY